MARGPELNLVIDSLSFADRPLFLGFSLTVAAGQTVALIGPSGVGKTTILRILAGIETSFNGCVSVDGISAIAAPVPGLVFQDARLLPWLTCEGNLRAVCPDLTVDAADRAMASVGLMRLGSAWPRQLSGGMQRRLGLARALLVNPRLLLLDEPFASLDRVVIRELHGLVAGLIAINDATAVLVSHDPGDAARLAHRVIVITGRPARIRADLMLFGDPTGRSRVDIAACEDLIDAALIRAAK